MLTLLKKIFTWWNQDTFGTRLKTIFFGKLVGSDELGNKYYESKNGKRWVIYANTIDASKIPVEWYSWMHFTPNKIEKIVMSLVINIMKVKMERDGLFMQILLMPLKYQWNGTLGCILHLIK